MEWWVHAVKDLPTQSPREAASWLKKKKKVEVDILSSVNTQTACPRIIEEDFLKRYESILAIDGKREAQLS